MGAPDPSAVKPTPFGDFDFDAPALPPAPGFAFALALGFAMIGYGEEKRKLLRDGLIRSVGHADSGIGCNESKG
jgi:hypothetical protein